jgi:hypothetical protein
LEPRFLFDAFGETDSINWLPRIFDIARWHHATPTPVATLKDLTGRRAAAFRKAIASDSEIKLAIRITFEEFDADLEAHVHSAVSGFGINPRESVLFLDFCDAHFGDVDAVSEFSSLALERVQDIGLWSQVVFQGTNYPDKNPATDGENVLVDRNEWLAWKQAATTDENVLTHLTFGDYCADNARFDFAKKGRGKPIPHYRYCTDGHWLVVRGKSKNTHADAMRAVCNKILRSGMFAGQDFSSADEFIYGTAKGYLGPGNATIWREINTAHHITHVVSALGNLFGYKIQRKTITEPATQHELL